MMLISLSLTALKPLNKLTDDSLYIAHEIIFLMTYNCSPRSAEAFCSCMVFVNRNPWEFVTSTASGMLISTAKSPVVRVSESRGFFWRSPAHVNLVEPVLAMISRPLLNPMPFGGKFVWFQERKTSEVSSFSSYRMIILIFTLAFFWQKKSAANGDACGEAQGTLTDDARQVNGVDLGRRHVGCFGLQWWRSFLRSSG